MNKSGKAIGCALSYFAFFMSGCFIYSPLHKSQNIVLSLIFAFLTGLIFLTVTLKLFDTKGDALNISKKVFAILFFLCALLCIICLLMLITEVIKDVAYVASREISLPYYIGILTLTTGVSYYLCRGGKKGIFRFTILAVVIFILLFLLSFTSLSETKSICPPTFNTGKNDTISSIKSGIMTGLFFTCDSIIYLFCFRSFFSKEDNGKLCKKPIILGYLTAFTVIALYNLLTVLIFGTALTPSIKDIDYALIKLVPLTDITELISFVRIASFIIKSSVYIHLASECAEIVFLTSKSARSITAFIMYTSMPVIVIILSQIKKYLGFGAFQHLIYPAVIILSLLFALVYLCRQKSNS